MKVSDSPAFFERIANDARVFPAIARKGREPFDLSGIWPDCIGLEFDTGGLIFHQHEPDIYNVHILFLPKTRDAKGKALHAVGDVFKAGAKELIAVIPADLPHCRRLALAVGFEPAGQMGEMERNGGPVALNKLRLTREAWESQHMELNDGT